MLKAYKYRIYPTESQKELLERHFGCNRFLYNYFLDFRQKEYAKGIKHNYLSTQKLLTVLKKDKDLLWLNECASQSLQMALRNLDMAYASFFRGTGKYPRYKSKKNEKHSYTIPQNIKINGAKVLFPKFTKGVKIKLHRQIPDDARLKRATVSRVQGKYFISIIAEDKNEFPPTVKAKNAVGLDMGLENLVINSDGIKYINKRYFKSSQDKLKKFQRRLSKTKKGSANRAKAISKVQRVHTKIANQRNDYLHKISSEITNQYDIICVEDLNVKGMVKNKKLSKSISDVAWGKLLEQLQYKADWKGKSVVKIDRWFPSSQLCCVCGDSTGKKALNIRKFDCPSCGTKNIDRDLNASINIRNYGVGHLDDRHTAGTVGIKACGVSSSGVMSTDVISYDILKQEAQSSLAVG